MAKKPRPTMGVPEAVFQKELFKYLKRREAALPGKKVRASFTYNGTKYTFERGRGPYHSGYQIKTSAGQAAKEMARTEQKQNIKLSEGEKMWMREYYAAAAERNAKEGRTGNRKLEVDHREPRSKGGLHHPYNMGLMERGDNIKKGNKQGGFGKYQSLLSPDEFKAWNQNDTARKAAQRAGQSLPPRINAQGLLKQGVKAGLRANLVGTLINHAPDLIEIADIHTNGAISNAVDSAAKVVKSGAENLINGVQNGVNGVVDAYASSKPLQGGSNVDYGQ